MRDLLLSLVIPASFFWSMFSASGSILVLNWIWFQRPYDFSMGMWNTTPLFMVALGIAILSNLIRGELRLRFPPLLIVYLLLLFWITVSSIFAFDTEVAWQAYRKFLPSMWVAPILLFATIHDLRLLRLVLWVAAGSIGVNAFKTGISLMAQGGEHLTQQISGFVGDNNVFGLVLCLVVAILMGLRTTLPRKLWVRSLFYGFIAFVVLTIIYTKSRGAFASLGVILFMGSILSGRPVRNTLILVILIVGTYSVLPPEYFDRLSTTSNLSADVSAQGRFENWELAWRTAMEHPIFGVGPENHIPYNKTIEHGVQVRVAHSVYLQVLAELGFPGFGLYMLFVWMGFMTLFRTWRTMTSVAVSNPDLTWVRDTSFWLTCGYVGYCFGAAFLNMLYIEFPWYAVFYGSMLQPLVDQELSKREQIPPENPVRSE